MEKHEDIMKISKVIGPLMDKTAHEILKSYNEVLLAEPTTYIVPAVWGAKKEGELTASQKEMHKKISPVIDEIVASFELGEGGEAQKFAIGFIVRGYIISKITYMIESLKNYGIKNIDLVNKGNDLFEQMAPLGTA